MTFTSFDFLIFCPRVVLISNIVPREGVRRWFLLIASYFFYINMQPVYVILLALVTLSTYLFTRGISIAKTEKKKHSLEVWGIIVVLLPLFFFKYFSFINDSVEQFLHFIGLNASFPKITWALPVGISFYTFMAIGYIVDVYNEEVDYEPNIANVGLFLSFFPLVLSGPIERAGSMLPQINKMRRSTPSDITAGLKLMLWGYFMKLCVADRLGLYVDAVFGNIAHHNGTSLVLASVLYPFQVYADLGGYSLIAIGVARCIGFNIRPNFNRPFFATSMSEFWRRWHMSLITWLTDYIYTPLSFALRKWKVWGIVVALMLTFLISGVWHGAALTFIVWGVVQGIYLSLEALLQKKRIGVESKYNLNKKWWYTMVCCIFVFILFAFSQIFGRCSNVSEAITAISKIFTAQGVLFKNMTVFFYAFPCLFMLLVKDFFDEYFPNSMKLFDSKSIVIRWTSYIAIVVVIMLFGVFEGGSFIYFQF